jgi:hypothetical protein
MPRIESWANLPEGVRQHLIDRMHERTISIADLNCLRRWMESKPEVPEGDWYWDFGAFKLCGQGPAVPEDVSAPRSGSQGEGGLTVLSYSLA